MNDNKSRDIFYGVVAVATLIIALVGATLAYFSISVSSNEEAVNARGATVSIEYNDGQQVIAQATELIPATFAVVKQAYENNLAALNAQQELDAEIERSNVCKDSNGKEVCSIYRFSVKSDVERSIIATLNNEFNGFQYLAYAVRDVNTNTWLTLETDDEGAHEFIALRSCDNNNDDDNDNCYSTNTEGKKIYNSSIQAVNSIFGYTNNTKLVSKNVAGTTQVYDLLLFIKENNDNQNVDQGKEYRGTIIVDVTESDGTSGKITGYIE